MAARQGRELAWPMIAVNVEQAIYAKITQLTSVVSMVMLVLQPHG